MPVPSFPGCASGKGEGAGGAPEAWTGPGGARRRWAPWFVAEARYLPPVPFEPDDDFDGRDVLDPDVADADSACFDFHIANFAKLAEAAEDEEPQNSKKL